MDFQLKEGHLPHFFHLNLADHPAGEDYWIMAQGDRHPLIPHTKESIALMRTNAPHLAHLPDSYFTHYHPDPIHLPQDQVMRVGVAHSLKNEKNAKVEWGATHCSMIIPTQDGIEAVAAGENHPSFYKTMTYVDTAKSIIINHPDLMVKDPEVAGFINGYFYPKDPLGQDLITFSRVLSDLGPPVDEGDKGGYAERVVKEIEFTDKDKKRIKTNVHNLVPRDEVIQAAVPLMKKVLRRAKNDLRLKDKKWKQAEGKGAEHQQPAMADTFLLKKDDLSFDGEVTKKGENSGTKIEIERIGQYQESDAERVGKENVGKPFAAITLTNKYLRHLGVYLQFRDAEGGVIEDFPTDWKIIAADGEEIDNLGKNIDDLCSKNDHLKNWISKSKKLVGLLDPVETILSIPGEDGRMYFEFIFPKNATSVEIICGGQGHGAIKESNTAFLGIMFTWMFEIIIPTFMMGFAVAAHSNKAFMDLLKNKKVKVAVISVAFLYFAKLIYGDVKKTKRDGHFSFKSLATLSDFLFEKGMEKALEIIMEEVTEGEVENSIPFSGWAMIALAIAQYVSKIGQTVYSITDSPYNITNEIKPFITSKVTVHPDPRGAETWPEGGSKMRCKCRMVYHNEERTIEQIMDVPSADASKPLVFTFDKNILGGMIRFEVEFLNDNWISAKAGSDFIKNDTNQHENNILYLFQLPIPLKEDTIFSHDRLLIYNKSEKQYNWQATSNAPKATLNDLSVTNTGNEISMLTNLAYNQRKGTIGISYKANGTGLADATEPGTPAVDQLFAIQSVNIAGKKMNDVKFTDYGFSDYCSLMYNQYPAKFKTKKNKSGGTEWVLDEVTQLPIPDPNDIDLGNFYIDPRLANVELSKGGGYHLRMVNVEGKQNINPNSTETVDQESYGSFPYFPDHVTLHPNGFVIGVNQKECTIMILQLEIENKEPKGLSDQESPVARAFCGEAENKNREGLLFDPKAVSCSYDGKIYILEQRKSGGDENVARVQTFDVKARPIKCFLNGSDEIAFLNLTDDVTYLDMDVVGNEESTFILVSYYKGNQDDISNYCIDIYNHGKEHDTGKIFSKKVITIPNLPAPRMAMNLWHHLYILNCEMTRDENGEFAGPKEPNTGPDGRTVPSVSRWMPSLPKA